MTDTADQSSPRSPRSQAPARAGSPTGDGAVRDRLVRSARAARGRLAGGRTEALEAQVRALQERVADLEAEISETRRHHLRVAELTDVVQALLVPLATADRDQLDAVLARYSDQLG